LAADEEAHIEGLIVQLQSNMWANAGLLRDEKTLRLGLRLHADCEASLAEVVHQRNFSRRLAEAQSLSRVANAILISALARTESRGAHFRNDHPTRDDRNFQKHSVLCYDGKVNLEKW